MTKFILALDYELFFGSRTGSVQSCLLTPIDELLKVTDRYGVKLCLFVDAGFILRAMEHAAEYPELQKEVDKIRQQLTGLSQQGHDIQLHIHPHWIDSHFDGTQWHINTERYRLHDFDPDSIRQIVHTQKQLLTEISGKDVFAYRAGGWCIQPFDTIKEALWDEGIWLDSTVYHSGVSEDTVRGYDFSRASRKPSWRFESDPVEEEPAGKFVEVPISACKLYPDFFWKMVIAKKLLGKNHQAYGNGASMTAVSSYYLKRLTSPTYSVVSIDGLKAGTLSQALKQNRRWGNHEIFNVMGHPKSLTPYSIHKLDVFLKKHRPELEPVTFQDLTYMRENPNKSDKP